MGYHIAIGELADVEFPEEDCFNYRVKEANSPFAPQFGPLDRLSGQTNSRYPSYSGWECFCKEAGIHDLFYNRKTGLIRNHPGYERLNRRHLLKIREAMEYREAKVGLPPGFVMNGIGPLEVDPILARLMWLEFWINWALKNCRNPVILNR